MKTHSLEVGINKIDAYVFLVIKINGVLKHEDYETLTPLLEQALTGVADPKVKILIDARELDGFDLHAAWDDFKFALEFNSCIEKIAFIGSKSWEKYGVMIGSWFINAEMRYFENPHAAYAWLSQELPHSTPTQKDINSRATSIQSGVRELFEHNLKITDWNVPEADDKSASELLIELISQEVENIKSDIKDGKYN